MSAILETGIDYSRLNDMKYMRSYLMRLNDDLKYMLTNLDEDNYDAESLTEWQKFGSNVTELSRTAEELLLSLTSTSESMLAEISQEADKVELLLAKGSVTSTINVSTDTIKLSATRLKVTSDNFTLNGDDLTIKGEIQSNAGSIGSFNISKSGTQPYLEGSSSGIISGGVLEGTNGYFNSFSCAGSSSEMSNMWLDDATLNLMGCSVACKGAVFEGTMRITKDLLAADYDYSEDIYTARRQLFVTGDIKCDDIIYVETRTDGATSISDRGWAQVYSFIADDGEERSDRRLKSDIKAIDKDMAAAFIGKLRPVQFNYIDDPDKDVVLGLIAQDVKALQEEYGDFGLIATEEESGYMSLCYEHLIAFIAAAMQRTENILDGSN